MRAALAVLVSLAASSAAASDIVLSQPVDCKLGETCFIQHLTDRDPGPDAVDFRCGSLTYDGHKGTDFALPTLADMTRGVSVVAAAPGTVAGLRDGMQDRVYTAEAAAKIDGKECGNGVLIRHMGGWETQYCHLRKGSVQVTRGQSVGRGEILGMVGLSGKTQFPHLHLSVRREGQVIDPFSPGDHVPSCGTSPQNALWDNPLHLTDGGVIYAGFAPSVPDYSAIKAGTAAKADLSPTAPGLVLFGFAYGSRLGDVLTLDITGPKGEFLSHETELEKPQAQFFRAAGRKLTAERWPAGTYSGRVTLHRNGRLISQKTTRLTIP